MLLDHLIGLHRPRDRPSVVRDQPRYPDVSHKRAADLHRFSEVDSPNQRVLQRVEDRDQPRRDADVERASGRVGLRQDDVTLGPVVDRGTIALREYIMSEQRRLFFIAQEIKIVSVAAFAQAKKKPTD